MKIYAIKNIQTGLFLENGRPLAKTTASFSNKNTRLFTEKRAATNALKCWVMGIWRNKIDSYGELYGPEPPKTIPEDRKQVADFLKVVEADIEFK